MARRWTVVGSLVLAAAVLIWSALGSGDVRAVEQLLREAAVAAGDGRHGPTEVADLVAAPMVLEVEGDVRSLGLPRAEATLRSYVDAFGPRLHAIQSLEVTVRGQTARATGMLVISESQAGDLHAEERPFAVWLTRRQGWRITRLTLGDARKHIPEARP